MTQEDIFFEVDLMYAGKPIREPYETQLISGSQLNGGISSFPKVGAKDASGKITFVAIDSVRISHKNPPFQKILNIELEGTPQAMNVPAGDSLAVRFHSHSSNSVTAVALKSIESDQN